MRCPCGDPVRLEGQRYCRACHNACMRRTRPRYHELSAEQRRHATARAYLNVYVRRGKVQRRPCIVCGSAIVQAHHHDYARPLAVTWLCPLHHRATHVEHRTKLAS